MRYGISNRNIRDLQAEEANEMVAKQKILYCGLAESFIALRGLNYHSEDSSRLDNNQLSCTAYCSMVRTTISTCVQLLSAVYISMVVASMRVRMGYMVHLHGGKRADVI